MTGIEGGNCIGSSFRLGSALGEKGKKLAIEASREVAWEGKEAAALSPSQNHRQAHFAIYRRVFVRNKILRHLNLC